MGYKTIQTARHEEEHRRLAVRAQTYCGVRRPDVLLHSAYYRDWMPGDGQRTAVQAVYRQDSK